MAPRKRIDQLIVNSPYEEPTRYWKQDPKTRWFELKDGRRPAGYVVSANGADAFNDPGRFIPIPLANRIRPRVKAWREAGYPGVTGITKRLLEYWTHEPDMRGNHRLFFCQLEAVETLIWIVEAPATEKVGIEIPSDGGPFQRMCAKMATGSGKTVVMAMVIAWQVLNKVTYPQDIRFSKHVLVIAPGLTVRSRLAVLASSHPKNCYREFELVPSALLDKLRQGKVIVRNWHALNWETAKAAARKRSVDKRGPKSDAAWVREVLGKMEKARNLLILNDEAHHAWRPAAETKASKTDEKKATRWIAGLDRIAQTRGILACYDFSATPFAPSDTRHPEEILFDWIVSDFGLSDAIESGLVKTPRVVIRDDALPKQFNEDRSRYFSRFYHLYIDPDVKDDLNRRAQPEEPLPDLVTNGYFLLGYDWRETDRKWASQNPPSPTPPVMITVANRTQTAARIKHAFDRRRIGIEELCRPERILHIDSKVLAKAEEAEEPIVDVSNGQKPSQKQAAELLRRQVDTVGKPGEEGGQIQNVISVQMLSEGWDAKTVTHIMGLRAFTSQLLCEQVVGRGLRRTSYDINPATGLFMPEYVNVFGVPFRFLLLEGGDLDGEPPPRPPDGKTAIEPVSEKAEFEISWPNVLRIDYQYQPRLAVDWDRLEPLEIDASQTASIAELVPSLDGEPVVDVEKIKAIDLEKLIGERRTQTIIFETAAEVYDQLQANWKGRRAFLLAQVVKLVEQFIRRPGAIRIHPALFHHDEFRRGLAITLNMTKVVRHLWEAIRDAGTDKRIPVFDQDQPVRSTGDMRTWYTSRPTEDTQHSHINRCVFDSTWESSDAFALDHADQVAAWVKNDHLGFEVFYVYQGVVRKYRPDFLVRLKSGDTMVLETKGRDRDSEQNRVKRRALEEWVAAVNGHGGFGRWSSAVARRPGDIQGILAKQRGKSGSAE